MAEMIGSGASNDNAANWLNRLAPTAFFEPDRYRFVFKDLVYRAFTPVGSLALLVGFWKCRREDRLWRVWGLASLGMMILLFGKLHHDYYWLMVAAPASGMIGAVVKRIGNRSHFVSVGVLMFIIGLSIWQTRNTWRTPEDWRDATTFAALIDAKVPRDALVIAPEALLYLGKRRGCRLEYDLAGAMRAANEWRPAERFQESDPARLIDFYRKVSRARYFADLCPRPNDVTRTRLHEHVKTMPDAHVIAESQGHFLLVGFDEPNP
jgi:hypothetical protein